MIFASPSGSEGGWLRQGRRVFPVNAFDVQEVITVDRKIKGICLFFVFSALYRIFANLFSFRSVG